MPQSPSFTALHACTPNCPLGYPSDATAADLYDEAVLRQDAALSVLCALNDTPLNELAHEPLNGALQAVRLLCSDALGLYSAAWNKMQQSHT